MTGENPGAFNREFHMELEASGVWSQGRRMATVPFLPWLEFKPRGK